MEQDVACRERAKRAGRVTLAAAIAIATMAPSVYAHHSHPFFYDACRMITIEGRVDIVQWKDPHTLVIVRLDDGTPYTVDWMPLRGLTNNGIVGPAKEALTSGARVAVTGARIRTLAGIREHFPDYAGPVNPNTLDPTVIRRLDGSWSWAMRPPENPPDCSRK